MLGHPRNTWSLRRGAEEVVLAAGRSAPRGDGARILSHAEVAFLIDELAGEPRSRRLLEDIHVGLFGDAGIAARERRCASALSSRIGDAARAGKLVAVARPVRRVVRTFDAPSPLGPIDETTTEAFPLLVRVVDEATGERLPHAKVRLLRDGGDLASGEANDDGLCLFREVTPGPVAIEARSPGFETRRVRASITRPSQIETVKLEERRLRLYDPKHDFVPQAPCRITVDGAVALEATSDAGGYVSLRTLGDVATCTVTWGAKGAPMGSFQTRREIHLLAHPHEGPDLHAERLHNLGYSAGTSATDAIRAFQRHYGAALGLTESGQLDDATIAAIGTVHAKCPDNIREH